VRAHQHAAGRGPGPTQGDDVSCTFSPDEPIDHAIGRSRGGLTTKIRALTDQHCSPLTGQLSAGPAGDNPMLWPRLEEHQCSTRDRFRLLGDKAYSHNSTRDRLRKMKISHTIPERSDQIAWRKAKGSAGGRPPAFDPELYNNRNAVERWVQPTQAMARNRHHPPPRPN
jgi:putative transposase